MTPEQARRLLTAPVTFIRRSYGSTCAVCGASATAEDDQQQHRRAHEAIAVLLAERGERS